MAITAKHFLAGVIEGFYGKPWSNAERLELFNWMASWRLDTYLYAPKDDLKQRALWREAYSSSEELELREVVQAADRLGIRFFYALSPGLDIDYQAAAERKILQRRFEQMLRIGCRNFALLFDDISNPADPLDPNRWSAIALRQARLANEVFGWLAARLDGARFLFCPTLYCGRMAQSETHGAEYLERLGRELLPEIDVFWTGPEIISREINEVHLREIGALLRRKPLIWDNLHANDYDGRRFYCGPYSGRPAEIRDEVSGILVNPNNEFPLNFVPLRTLAAFLQCEKKWEAREAYHAAMAEWLPRFATFSEPIELEDVVLFGDCYYLPHECGAEAEALYAAARDMLAHHLKDWAGRAEVFRSKARRLSEFCARVPELRDRALFHALSRRVWDLREELDLLQKYIEFISTKPQERDGFTSQFHLPGTYRGGMVARLQQLLEQRPDGTFLAATGVPGTERICN